MREDGLRRLPHEPLSLQQNIDHTMRNDGLHRARKISSRELRVAFRGMRAGVINPEIHPDECRHCL